MFPKMTAKDAHPETPYLDIRQRTIKEIQEKPELDDDIPRFGLEGFFLALCRIHYRAHYLTADILKYRELVKNNKEPGEEEKFLRIKITGQISEIESYWFGLKLIFQLAVDEDRQARQVARKAKLSDNGYIPKDQKCAEAGGVYHVGILSSMKNVVDFIFASLKDLYGVVDNLDMMADDSEMRGLDSEDTAAEGVRLDDLTIS